MATTRKATRRARVAAVAAAAALVLAAAACGSDSSGSGTTDTSGGAGRGPALERPVKLALLWEVKGESAAATDEFQNGAQMAIDAINAAGGVGGHPVEATRVPMPLDPQRAGAAYLQALDADPTVAIGFPGVTQLLAARANIERGGVPLVATPSGDDVLRLGHDGGSEWLWPISPPTPAITASAVDYVTGELGMTEIGLMGTNETYGTQSIADSTRALEAKGLEPYAERTYAPTATDLTEQVLAMKGAQAVLDWGYPNPLAVQLKQFQQNGLEIPTFTAAAAAMAVNNGLATGEAISRLYGVIPCNPPGTTVPALQDFARAYQQRYGEPAGSLAALAHDAVQVAVAAVERAGSTDPAAVNRALGQVDVTQGVVCSGRYKADASQFLNHQLVVAKWSADGSSTTAKTYTVAELARGGS